jgi:iron complex outermembrane recepter protein
LKDGGQGRGIVLRRALLCGGALAAFTGLSAQNIVVAQDATSEATGSSPTLEVVTVTAEKRATDVQRTPISIMAIDGDNLKGSGPADIQSLTATTPSVLFGQVNGQSEVTIRGIGNDQVGPGFEARTANYIDGVYIASLNGLLGTFYDLDRVEIAEGPQGDLYGRNATAGAVDVITKKPDLSKDLNGYFQFTGGNYALTEAQGAFGASLSDTVAVRLSADVVSRGGYGEDTYTHTPINDQHSGGARAELLWKPVEALSVLVTTDYYNENDANYTATYGGNYNDNLSPTQLVSEVAPSTLIINGVSTKIYGNVPTGVLVGYSIPTDKNDISEDSVPIYRNEAYGLNVTTNYDLSGDFTLRSITGYRYNNHFQQVPVAYTPGEIDSNGVWERVQTGSQEFQVIGNLWHQHFVAGLYYFYDANYNLVEVAEGYPEKIGTQQVPPGQYAICGCLYP